MNTATLQLVLEARDLASPALERLRKGARQAGEEGGRAAKGLHGLQRAGQGLEPAAGSMEKLRSAMRDMAAELPEAATRAAKAFGELRQRALDPGLASMNALQQSARGLYQTLGHNLQAPARALPPGDLPQRYNNGGTVFRRLATPLISQGSGHEDDVPALLMRGEFVLKKDAVRKYGLGFLHALNQMQLPPVPFEAVPRFASGGLALPEQALPLVPRFAGGGMALRFGMFAEDLLQAYGARSYDDIVAQTSEKVQEVMGKLNLPQMQETPSDYLADVLGVVVQNMKPFSTEGNDTSTSTQSINLAANETTQELERKKQTLNEEFRQRIAAEKQSGNEALAGQLELLRLEIENMIVELQIMIQDIAAAYRDNVEKVAQQAEDDFLDLSEKYYEKEQEISDRLTKESAKGWSLSHGDFFAQELVQERDYDLGMLKRDYASKASRIERNVESDFKSEERMLERELKKQFYASEATGELVEKEGRVELKEVYQDYLRAIQDLEIEWKKRLQELDDEYGKTSITGFKHWLAAGGPVGFARGGLVPQFSWAAADRDSVPAMLTPGEFVINKQAAQTLGRDALERLNGLGDALNRNLQPILGFAEGGEVPGAESMTGDLLAAAPQSPWPSGDWGTLNIRVSETSHPVMAEADVARALRKVLHKQERVTA